MFKKNEKEVDTSRWDESEVVSWFICWDTGMVYHSLTVPLIMLSVFWAFSSPGSSLRVLTRELLLPCWWLFSLLLSLLAYCNSCSVQSSVCSMYVKKWNHLHLKSHWPWGWRHGPQCPDTEVIERKPSRSKITSTSRLPSLIANFGDYLPYTWRPSSADITFFLHIFTLWWIMCLLSWLWDMSALHWEKRCRSEKTVTLVMEPVALDMTLASSQRESQWCV